MILATAPSDNIYYITPTARKYQLIPPQGRKEGAGCYVAMVVMVLCCFAYSYQLPTMKRLFWWAAEIDTMASAHVRSVLIEGPCPWCPWFLVLVLSGLLVLRKKEQ